MSTDLIGIDSLVESHSKNKIRIKVLNQLLLKFTIPLSQKLEGMSQGLPNTVWIIIGIT
jgi:Tfp pilus assembly protein PilN